MNAKLTDLYNKVLKECKKGCKTLIAGLQVPEWQQSARQTTQNLDALGKQCVLEKQRADALEARLVQLEE